MKLLTVFSTTQQNNIFLFKKQVRHLQLAALFFIIVSKYYCKFDIIFKYRSIFLFFGTFYNKFFFICEDFISKNSFLYLLNINQYL